MFDFMELLERHRGLGQIEEPIAYIYTHACVRMHTPACTTVTW